MIAKQSIASFTDALNSKSPVPGGGGVSALAGALAACLGGMAAHLTIGKKKFIPVEDELKAHLALLTEHAEALLACIDEDAAAFEPLSRAYGLPAETDAQKSEKQQVLERCLWAAAQPPLKILRIGAGVTQTLHAMSANVSKLVQSDVGCAAAMARACVQCAALNVWVNAQLMTDEEKSKQLYDQSRQLLRQSVVQCDAMVADVEETLCRR